MQTKSFRDLVFRALNALKKNIILLLCIIIAFSAVGAVYGLTRTQKYSATELATYKAKIIEGQDNPYDYTATKVYLDTVKEFFVSGNVLARADAYYEDYLSKRETYPSVKEYSEYIYENYEKTYTYQEMYLNQGAFIGKEIYFDVALHVGNGTGYDVINRKVIGVFQGFEIMQENMQGTLVPGLFAECLKIKHIVDTEQEVVLRCQYKFDGANKTYRDVISDNRFKDYYNDTYNYVYATDFTFRENVVEVQTDKKHFSSSNINISASKGEDEDISFAMGVTYTDLDPQVATDKAKILVLALDVESKTCVPNSNIATNVSDYLAEFKYFGVKVSLNDWDTLSVVETVNIKKIILTFVLLGVVISLVAVFVVCILDRTVRDKVELESLVGASCLATIEDAGGK
ncbi:MAG: hypothetical protein IJY57_02225 [Clostridia bacterium]|nr:hypothetical protein [Clostridia bacterium]